jgi:hypothetical protein
MTPAIAIDNISDFKPMQPKAPSTASTPRTLLLSPPSLSSHPERLDNVIAAHDRSATDIQMLDRLSLSLVSLPQTTYDIILVLLDADNTRTESKRLITGDLLLRIVDSLKPGGRIQSQDGAFATIDADERGKAILAGLIMKDNEVVKPDPGATQSVPLRLGKTKSEGGPTATTGAVSLNLNGKRTKSPTSSTQPAGVGFVDFSDDFDGPEVEDDDDELIDEDTLLDDDDMKGPVFQRKYFHNPSRLCKPTG